MKAWAILGYVAEGCVYCAQCSSDCEPDDRGAPVFASDELADEHSCECCGIQLSEAAPAEGTDQ